MNTVQYIYRAIEKQHRILVTSDIHGHYSCLHTVLKQASFSCEDLLVIAGDIVEKGPENLKTLRYVMELSKQENVVVLAGNVDAMRVHMFQQLNEENADRFYEYILSLRDWIGTSLFDEMTKELGCFCTTPVEMLAIKDKVLMHFKPELDFIANLPTVLETQNYIFVHGGLPCSDLQESLKRSFMELTKVDSFMDTAPCFEKYIVVGHWPVSLYNENYPITHPVFDHKKKIISIDGGCGLKEYGQLNLLIIPSIDCPVESIYHISADLLPKYRVMNESFSELNSTHVDWRSNEIKILQRENNRAFVQQLLTGKKLWIPETSLIDDSHCKEFTNYMIPLNIGEIVSLVNSFGNNHLVKKDDIVGWYHGELQKI